MKSLSMTIALIAGLSLSARAAEQWTTDNFRNEPYRPAYHFTPAHRWIGDPCGLVRHDGRWLAYSWGGAVSDDLVHWRELNDMAIKGVPEGTATFTGSVVVDKMGSAGYGKDALIAVFTSFDEQSKKQSQSIAFSLDGGETYQYYDRNPVLDIWSTEFRDPTVVRDRKNNRWVMAVAKALEKKVAFYGSADLKNWEWLSDFGPMGDNERSWECPDLFEVCIDGNPENKKWVLLVSVNWAREQYFTGDFDGTRFIPDKPYSEPLYVDEGLDYYASRVFQDYDSVDSPVYTLGWVNTWDYATQAPSTWGKGIWSIPREYGLVSTPDGLRLAQTPLKALEGLRGEEWSFGRTLRRGVTPLQGLAGMDNSYEMELTWEFGKELEPVGLYLFEGEGRRLKISYDPASGYLTLDRTDVADVELPKFRRTSQTRVMPEDGRLTLRIFVDKSVVEIFTADGLKTMTALTYASPSQTGASAWSLGGDTRLKLKAWRMASAF